jgi:tRNA A64-2'-O-ribosylphosphate transferase
MRKAGVLSLSGKNWCLNQSITDLRAASASSKSYERLELESFDFTTTISAIVVDIILNSKYDLTEIKLIDSSMDISTILTVAMSTLESLKTVCISFPAQVAPSRHEVEAVMHSIGCGLLARACTLKTLILKSGSNAPYSMTRTAAFSLRQGMIRNKSLECLHIDDCRFCTADAVQTIARGMRSLGIILKDVRLRSCLGPSGRPLDDGSLAILIGGLEHNPRLEKLDLSKNKCLDEGISALAALMDRSPGLAHVDLSCQDVNTAEDESMDLLPLVGALGRTSTLQSLELKYNKLSSERDMACLAAALMHNTSVKYIGLAGNKITNSGIEIFASRIASMRVLEKLILSENAFDEEGANELANAMEKNLSIIKVECDQQLPSFRRIQYFADLNWSGRKYVKSFAKIKPSVWSLLFSRATTSSADGASLPPQRQVDVLFFLLRHAPASLFPQSWGSSLLKRARNKKKETNKARHRLLSIYRDAKTIEQVYPEKLSSKAGTFPLVSNERCGSWYLNRVAPSCYFKSTDGHVSVWDFSLKRLNLPFLFNVVCKNGGCVVVDSSVRKLLPDSFSRTIPIWAAVINRIAKKYSHELGMALDSDNDLWNNCLCTPAGVVPEDEHKSISMKIESHVDTLHRSRAIVDPRRLVRELRKPIRVAWMNFEGNRYLANAAKEDFTYDEESLSDEFFWIICWNPSRYKVVDTVVSSNADCAWRSIVAPQMTMKNHVQWIDELSYYYTPGAADDHESWASHFTSALFWEHHETLIDPSNTDDHVEELIQSLAPESQDELVDKGRGYTLCDQIGGLNIWVGSRRAGRPPECWDKFDAVLNVTTTNYPHQECQMDRKFYLQLHVEEGKKDKAMLEKYMPLGLAFLIHHHQHGRRILVHCAQGKDRSVAMVLVFVCLACTLTFPLELRPDFHSWDMNALEKTNATDMEMEQTFNKDSVSTNSGLSSGLVMCLLEKDGGELFLRWIHDQAKIDVSAGPLADKESVRIALHLIRQDREVAEPARATMQKINRFLMSNFLYRDCLKH